MELDNTDEILLTVAAARFSVEFETSHSVVADRAERLSTGLLDTHAVTPVDATTAIFIEELLLPLNAAAPL